MYIKKILIAIFLIGLLLMAGFAYYVYSIILLPNTAFNNDEAHIYIPTGADYSIVLNEISPLLEDVGTFETVAAKKGYKSNVKSGHFIIKNGMSNNEIINTIRSKNIPIYVRFNNQQRIEDLAGHVARQIEADSLSLLNSMRDADFLKSNDISSESALSLYIPNTYEFYWNSSATTFRDRMLREYKNFWTEARQKKAETLGLSREEVISLAAIVQKETVKNDERPKVAGVYLNRIKVGMLLQADPTVIFAKKKAENDFEQVIKRVLYKDLEIDSPYNTYKYAGIPPGPIAMPDISSIDAVLNPATHDYFYFVADVTNFGYHKFAKNLQQHNVNKREYVAWLSKNNVDR